MVAAPELTLVGLQARAETTAAIRLKVVLWAEPFRVAVTVALWFALRTPAVAMKLAELAPVDTVTVAGVVRRALLFDSATAVTEEASWFKLTVQVTEAPDVTVPGLQLRAVNPSGRDVVIVPPVASAGILPPAADVLTGLVTLMVVPELAADIVTVRTATTPFWMTFAFSPLEPIPVKKQL